MPSPGRRNVSRPVCASSLPPTVTLKGTRAVAAGRHGCRTRPEVRQVLCPSVSFFPEKLQVDEAP